MEKKKKKVVQITFITTSHEKRSRFKTGIFNNIITEFYYYTPLFFYLVF